ncbi:putative inactive purple acid phosphatase 16 [Podospora australis]|uniref:Inactive purple acid phosphatase 16 n=1 Tax=Podospora australis TaxID=1536484 RepID=A0AAN6WUE8_9PEZI|nr:putative inactive purple acid phosphatase 16 [Podospora australis]
MALALFLIAFFLFPLPTENRWAPWPSSSSSSASTEEAFGPLAFRKDGTFQISILGDLHFGENAWDPWGPAQDRESIKVIEKVFDEEPNTGLVVLNGDLITGENTFLENSTLYVDQIVAPIVDRKLTWASTYGNHDSDFNISRSGIFAREKRWPNSRTRQDVSHPDAGVTNYYLPVYPHADDSGTPSLILWFFDSRGGWYFQQKDPATKSRVGQPNWVDQSVVSWFKETNASLVKQHGGKVIPSLAFVHIPVNASLAFQDQGVDAHRQPGINADVPVSQQGQGWCEDGSNGDECVYGGQDVPFMKAIASTPGLLGVFSGHDHGNSWCYKWDRQLPGMNIKGNEVNLCFGQHSGYGGYGNWIRGARQVVVSLDGLQEGEADTYIRLEDGRVVGRVGLNETYGRDLYEATPDDKTRCPTCG